MGGFALSYVGMQSVSFDTSSWLAVYRAAFHAGDWQVIPLVGFASLLLGLALTGVRHVMTRRPAAARITLGEFDADSLKHVIEQVRHRLGQCLDLNHPDIVLGVQELIRGAIAVQASDIHLSPLAAGLQVTYRVHGSLHEVLNVGNELAGRVVNRIKVMSRLDLHVRSNPQDGRLVTRIGTDVIEARVSTLPTESGERVVLRLVRGGRSVPQLETLGFSSLVTDQLQQLLARPQGLIFVTGPVGSGKTTTLYAALEYIARSRGSTTSLVTLEDPIELELPFATQTQMNAKTGMKFASVLRSVLRQDPNVLMLGEIRDPETADIAMQAALTGHLILTTVHADGAAGPFARLIDMKIEPFLLASGTIGSLSQRLVRTLCQACRSPADPEPIHRERLGRLGIELPGQQFFEPRGCELCEMQGFVGRTPIVELLLMSGTLREAVHQCLPTESIRLKASEQGMASLLHDGLRLAEAGETSLTEVLRVAG